MIFADLGYDGGGWIWALVLGGFVFYKGIRIHFRELTPSWGEPFITPKIPLHGEEIGIWDGRI
jgi:hypothetical protein